jgi:hypothetical protein
MMDERKIETAYDRLYKIGKVPLQEISHNKINKMMMKKALK